ncbi:MAG: hypothetical protein NVS3B25_07330 [Hymenobacter sp.]
MAAWALFVRYEIRRNAELIAANGAADTLHEAFHRARTTLRVSVASLLAVAASAPLLGHWTADLSYFGLLALFAGSFVRCFNPALSLARGKAADYVSEDPHAAFFDRFIWWLTNKLHGGVALPGYVSRTFWLVLDACWLGGVALYLLSLALIAHFLPR